MTSHVNELPPETQVTRARALTCFLLNLIVFPGLGTLASGDPSRRRIGLIQLGMGAMLTPLLLLLSTGSALFASADPETVKAWLWNFMLILVVWNVLTGVQILRKAWRQAN